MKHNRWRVLAVCMVILGMTPYASGADEWRTRAKIEVAAPGIVEAVLPPELIFTSSHESIDLVLQGPDGLPRAFELYRREKTGRIEWPLTPVDVTFKEPDAWVWEGKTGRMVEADQVQIEVADQSFVARVDVAAERSDGWVSLKKDAALFKVNGEVRTLLEIEKNRYQRVRLTFKSFDKRYRRQFSPILKVLLAGERTGKEHHTREVFPEFQQFELENATEVRGILPGSGLWIDAIRFHTQAQFQGSLESGIETIENGVRKFRCLKSYTLEHVNRDKQVVSFRFDGVWPGRNLILKLHSQGAFVGRVADLALTVKSPRMVFLADSPGGYLAISGAGKRHAVYEYPGDENRLVDHEALFSAIETNQDLRPATLLEKYRITGGPFNEAGYAWKSNIPVPAPGYYRLVLNMDASLEKRHQDIRIVKEKTQVPFLFGRDEEREVDLMASTDVAYDPDPNKTTLRVALPKASPNWTRLVLSASGIFRRSLTVEIPKPGNMGWQKWRSAIWENRDSTETRFTLDLNGLSEHMDQIRIVMEHGDNEPVKVSRILAFYTAPGLNFIARERGAYELYGGHSEAGSPVYDLSLVQASLLEELPQTLQMGARTPIGSADFRRSFEQIFSDRGWGLYVMLGIVTLVLLILVVRLFPREDPE